MSNGTGTGGTRQHRWRFFRSGGFDQVRLETAEDLRNLDRLDQKLWAALACPTRGVELDARTLDLLDTDHDGRIRPPEVLAAVRWACSVLKNPEDLTRRDPTLPLSAIDDSQPEGRRLLASARQILDNLGKAGASGITVEDTADTRRIFAETRFNGDGVVPPAAADDPALASVLEDVIRCIGSEMDRSGTAGVSQGLADTFFEQARAFADWWAEAEAEPGLRPLGDSTLAAADAFERVKPKVDDYFTRCRLAAFDPKAAEPLNPPAATYQALTGTTLSSASEALAAMPLARVEAGGSLPLTDGVNPAWADAVARLRQEVVEPLLGKRTSLSAAEWADLSERFAAYEAWLARKAGTLVEPLGISRVREVLGGEARERVSALIARDRALEAESNDIASVDRLARYYRDLFTLLSNFVSFRDFYTAHGRAVFQAGTLYLDGRSCELCVQVDDAGKHSGLANLSRTYLAYCECVRRGSGETKTIAAAFTAGDADNLMVGRNGVFYDRQGRDWDATIVKILEHPISVSQAFWSPYRQIARMVAGQVEKLAGAREKAVQEKAAAGIADVSQKAEAGAAAPPPPFDIAKFAGIFAAIGLAIGAIGTAIASVVTGFLTLAAWQMPLAVVGLVLAISGPSMVIAWLKLRQRTLAPILDANGWAINTLAKINIPFGTSLTSTAELPPGAQRSLQDPYAEKKRPWKTYLVLAALVGALAVLGYQGHLQRWWGQVVRKVEQTRETARLQKDEAPAAPAAPATAAPAAKPEPTPAPETLPRAPAAKAAAEKRASNPAETGAAGASGDKPGAETPPVDKGEATGAETPTPDRP